MRYCIRHKIPYRMYGGQVQCPECKKESVKHYQALRLNEWFDHIPVLKNANRNMHFHHDLDNPIINWMDQQGWNFSITNYIQNHSYTFLRGILVRLELKKCKLVTVQWHTQHHSLKRWRNVA